MRQLQAGHSVRERARRPTHARVPSRRRQRHASSIIGAWDAGAGRGRAEHGGEAPEDERAAHGTRSNFRTLGTAA